MHFGAARFEVAQILKALGEAADLLFVEAAGGFLAVAGDEGHGIAGVEQRNGADRLFEAEAEFGGEALNNGIVIAHNAYFKMQNAKCKRAATQAGRE
jgi:hypothetical protein